MGSREAILRALWEALWGVEGIKRVSRNPESAPNAVDLPCCNIFELTDTVTDCRFQTDAVVQKRNLMIAVEVFIAGTSEDSASYELLDLTDKVRAALFARGGSLLGVGGITEIEASKIEIIPGGDHVRGIGVAFNVKYHAKIGI